MRGLLLLDERLRYLELPPRELLRHAREFDGDVEEVRLGVVNHDGRCGGQEEFEQVQKVPLRPAVTVELYDLRDEPALLFERLWTETGCQDVIASFARKRGYRFALERAVFLTVLHRLMQSGSDLAADRWREDYRIAGSDDLDLHHLYRAMAWLGEELPAEQQDAATKFAPRCTKDLIEEELFARRRDLFSRLDLVFLQLPCTSRGAVARRSGKTASARTTGPICHR